LKMLVQNVLLQQINIAVIRNYNNNKLSLVFSIVQFRQ